MGDDGGAGAGSPTNAAPAPPRAPGASASTIKWAEVQELVDKRQQLRVERDYKAADVIRDKLLAMQVTYDDDTKKWSHPPSGASGEYSAVDWSALDARALRGVNRVPPNHQVGDRDWTCPKCTNVNWARRMRCNRCNEARPAAADPAAAGAVLSKRETIRRENQEAREEMRACDAAFLKAKAEREAREALLQQEDELMRQRDAEYASAHPLPQVTGAPAVPTAAVAKATTAAAAVASAPPQPKAGRDLSGVAKLKRAREEMLAERERRASKAQKTSADAAPGGARAGNEGDDGDATTNTDNNNSSCSNNHEISNSPPAPSAESTTATPAKAPLTLSSMSLAIAADDKLQLLKNVRILAKAVTTKTDALRRMGKLAALFRDVATWPRHTVLKTFKEKEATILQEACCGVVAGLVRADAAREEGAREVAMWLLGAEPPAAAAATTTTTTPVTSPVTPMLPTGTGAGAGADTVGPTIIPLLTSFLARHTADAVKLKALPLLPAVAAHAKCGGLWGRKLKERFAACGVIDALSQLKVGAPPAVMAAMRAVVKELQELGIER